MSGICQDISQSSATGRHFSDTVLLHLCLTKEQPSARMIVLAKRRDPGLSAEIYCMRG